MKKIPNLFELDSYDTPNYRKRAALDKFFLGSRAYFYWWNSMIFLQSGICAGRGKLNAENQIYYSNKNVGLVERCGGKIHIRGLENIDKVQNEAVVLISNHMSSLETSLFHAILRPRIDFTFVIKKSLLDIPFFGNIMHSMKAIPVTRTNPKDDFKQVMARGSETLAKGRSIILFPQATRSARFSPEHFNTIGIKLAKNANVRVVPIALKTDFVANGKFIRELGPIQREEEVWFEFGEPMEIKGTGKEEHQIIIDFIESRLSMWRKKFVKK